MLFLPSFRHPTVYGRTELRLIGGKYIFMATVEINEAATGQLLQNVITHELLHVLGIAHSDEYESVMNKTVGTGELKISEYDIRLLRSKYGVP